MPFKISEVLDLDDFKKVVKVEFDAYSSPLNSLAEVYLGPTIEETATRQWMYHTMVAGSQWIKAVDTETGEVVGAAEWIVHEKNPYKQPGSEMKATWWPEDNVLHEMGNQMLTTFMAQRPNRMSRPHILLNVCFVGRKHRRRGVGRLLVGWGVALVEKLGMEAFIEATEAGRPLYEAFGFKAVDYFTLDVQSKDGQPSEAWLAERARIVPEPYKVWFMWRPAGGRYVEGKTRYSWEVDCIALPTTDKLVAAA